MLNRLEDRDLVRRREPYWALGDLDDELGPESREQWLRAAEDEG